MTDNEINILRELYYHKRENGTQIIPELTTVCDNALEVCQSLSDNGLVDFEFNNIVHINCAGEGYLIQNGIVSP